MRLARSRVIRTKKLIVTLDELSNQTPERTLTPIHLQLAEEKLCR